MGRGPTHPPLCPGKLLLGLALGRAARQQSRPSGGRAGDGVGACIPLGRVWDRGRAESGHVPGLGPWQPCGVTHGVTGTFGEQDTPAAGWEAQVGVSLGGRPGAPPASRDSGGCLVPLPPGPGITCDPGVEPYPVGLCGDVLRAVRDLRLAAVQDAPDDRNAGHLLPATDQVLRLLKGHYPAGCRGPGQRSGGPGLGPFSTPTLPPPSLAQTPGVCSSASPPPTP